LDLKSQMLFSSDNFYLNGEVTTWVGEPANILTKLADQRYIEASNIQDTLLLQQLYDWYIAGYLSFNS
jgi:50S ribosomal protein L16 3-hydroxylase